MAQLYLKFHFRFLLILFLNTLTITPSLWGQERCVVPSIGHEIEVIQPNGENIRLKLIGNPFLSYYETDSGYTVVKDSEDGFYKFAITDSKGNLVPGSIIVTSDNLESVDSNSPIQNIPKHLRHGEAVRTKKRNLQNDFLHPNYEKRSLGPLKEGKTSKVVPQSTGTFRHLLLLIDYPDYPFTNDNAAFDAMMNEIGYNVNGQAGSFKEFYLDTSYGNLSVETTVVGWYTAAHGIAHYGHDPELEFPFRAPELVREAVDAAEAAGVDFSQFDNNGDGICDVVTIAHAGPGAEYVGWESRYIWSHKSGLGANSVIYDGVLISGYTMNPETDGGEGSTGISNISVYVHEFGHALGLPDLYNFDTSNGAGRWCNMSWSSDPRTPVEFNPWFKEKLNWMSPTILQGSGTVTDMGNTNDGATYYRVNTDDPQEFYMLANMQKTKWHSKIPNSGLMIWHIDTSRPGNNDVNRMHAVPEQADGLQHLQEPHPSGNLWDAGDPYPGTSGNTAFNTTSSPNSNTNDGDAVAMSITNISESNGLISFDYSDGTMKSNQSITFDVIPDKVYGDADFEVAATASSGLPVTISILEGPVTLSGNVVSIQGAGVVRLLAEQGGDASFNPAQGVELSFTVLKAEQDITIEDIPDKLTTAPAFDIVASVDSGLALDYGVEGPATISGNTVTLNGSPGTVTVTVSQAGNQNHNPGTRNLQFKVTEPSRLDQSITFGTITDKVYGDPDFEVAATASSGLPVALSVLEGPVTLSDNVVSIQGAGVVRLLAEQGGDASFNPAQGAELSFTVLKAEQDITIEDIPDKLTTAPAFDIVASVDSGLPLDYGVEGPATLSGNTITLDGSPGTVTVTVSQAGDQNHNPGSRNLQFNVTEPSRLDQSITFDAVTDKVYGDADFEVAVTATSGLPVALSVLEGPVTLNGNIVSIEGAGSVRLLAEQGGDASFNPAQGAELSFTVLKAEQNITIEDIPDKLTTAPAFGIMASVDSGLPLDFGVEGPAILSGNTITLNGSPGTVTVTVSQSGDQNHNPGSRSLQFKVTEPNRLDQSITFGTITDKVYGDADFEVAVTATSGLPVALSVLEGPVTLNGNIVSIEGAGSVRLLAEQEGNVRFNPSQGVERSFTVLKAEQNITIVDIPDKLATSPPFDIMASVDSDLPLVYGVEGPVTISGNTITLDGTSGMVKVNVLQNGNPNYNAAIEEISFEVFSSLDLSNVHIYPNPTKGILSIESPKNLFFNLYTLNGKKIMSEELQDGNMDLSGLSGDIYILEGADIQGNVVHKKIVKIN